MIDSHSKKEKGSLQIQPVRASRDKWGEYASAEGISFEILELSTPPALNESGLFESCIEWYRDSGRVRSLHGNFIDVNPGSGDVLFRELSKKRCRESCEAAIKTGAENVVFHSSCFPFLRGAYLEGWSALCADFYDELAGEYDLNIFIENSPDIDPEPLKNLMSVVKDSRIGVCLDLGHANYSQVGIAGWFEELGDKIGYLHLSDNMGTYDDHLPLGQGSIDWDETDRLWRGLKRDTPLTLEVGNLDNVMKSVDFLKEKGLFGQ